MIPVRARLGNGIPVARAAAPPASSPALSTLSPDEASGPQQVSLAMGATAVSPFQENVAGTCAGTGLVQMSVASRASALLEVEGPARWQPVLLGKCPSCPSALSTLTAPGENAVEWLLNFVRALKSGRTLQVGDFSV